MSGPVSTDDAPTTPAKTTSEPCEVDVVEGRPAEVGGIAVRRVLPRRKRRTVGAWCFVDHMGPAEVGAVGGPPRFDVGPHPHIGLQTVTWLFEGAVLHRDSLGSEQLIRPGQLNLMTAGHGVAHAEETAGTHGGSLHGVQLWVALPAATREGAPAFEHHPVLPRVELPGAVATVLVGDFLDASSPARRDTDHVGVELSLRPGRVAVPLDPGFEHALVAIDGAVGVGSARLHPGQLGYLGVGRDELAIDADGADDAVRLLLLGGAPFPEPLLMWWNYVARTREEITAAHRDWTARAARFGTVASSLPAMEAPGPPWSTERA